MVNQQCGDLHRDRPSQWSRSTSSCDTLYHTRLHNSGRSIGGCMPAGGSHVHRRGCSLHLSALYRCVGAVGVQLEKKCMQESRAQSAAGTETDSCCCVIPPHLNVTLLLRFIRSLDVVLPLLAAVLPNTVQGQEGRIPCGRDSTRDPAGSQTHWRPEISSFPPNSCYPLTHSLMLPPLPSPPPVPSSPTPTAVVDRFH